MIAYVSTSNKGKLNLRAEPSINAKVLVQIPYGKQVNIESVEGEWSKITYEQYNGYVKSEFLSTSSGVMKQDLQKIYNSLKNTLETIETILGGR